MSDERLLTIKELKQLITKNDTGLLFCFGTSLISRIIQAKTKLNNNTGGGGIRLFFFWYKQWTQFDINKLDELKDFYDKD